LQNWQSLTKARYTSGAFRFRKYASAASDIRVCCFHLEVCDVIAVPGARAVASRIRMSDIAPQRDRS